MEDQIRRALAEDPFVDITTVGRKTKLARRIEIWCHYHDGRIFLTGRPGKPHWYANLCANSDFTFHLKKSVQRDISAKARPITDEFERRAVFTRMQEFSNLSVLYNLINLKIDEWVRDSPLVEVVLNTG